MTPEEALDQLESLAILTGDCYDDRETLVAAVKTIRQALKQLRDLREERGIGALPDGCILESQGRP